MDTKWPIVNWGLFVQFWVVVVSQNVVSDLKVHLFIKFILKIYMGTPTHKSATLGGKKQKQI